MKQTNAPAPRQLVRDSAQTLAVQLKNIFRDKMVSGEWPANGMIPSENQLSALYGVSRMTVRGVISQFVTAGLMYRVPGKGTFVSGSKYELSSLMYSGLRGQLEEQGHSVTTELISCECVPANGYHLEWLGVAPGEMIYIIKRTRAANGVTISLHESYVPRRFCPGLEHEDLRNEQLCRIMRQKYGIERKRVVETLESFPADRAQAAPLDVRPGFPLILLQDTLFTEGDAVYEYSRVYFRGDKTKIRLEYTD